MVKKHFITFFNNLSLKAKLFFVILIITSILAIVDLLSVNYINHANQELLYESISSSLESSAQIIEEKLNNYVEITSKILSNDTVQNTLSIIADSSTDPDFDYSVYIKTLDDYTSSYYYTDSTGYIVSVTLQNKLFTSSTFAPLENRLSNTDKSEITLRANRNNGKPTWITDYADSYGLILARSIRRMDQLKLDNIGTILFVIDLRQLIEDAFQNLTISDGLLFALYDENTNVFLCSEETNTQEISKTVKNLSSPYGIVTIEGIDYFASKGAIRDDNWGYFLFVPYERIVKSITFAKTICFIFILICCFLLLIFSDWWIIRLTRHFNLLIYKMVSFGKDDTVLPSVQYDYSNRRDEIAKLHNQFDLMAIKIQTLINENYKQALLKKEMELKALQNQINPHFLYNTLDSINWRAKAIGEEQISTMVQSLAQLLRASLCTDGNHFTIGSELDIVNNYITIQKIRFDDKLNYFANINNELLDVEIPLLSIQPLVENAINYGLEENIDGCYITLDVLNSGKNVIIRVTNNGSLFEDNFMQKLVQNETTSHGFGIGMLNIHKRIQMTYGAEYGINAYNNSSDCAVVEIIIPY